MYEFIAIITTLFMAMLGTFIGESANANFNNLFATITMGYFILRKLKKIEKKKN